MRPDATIDAPSSLQHAVHEAAKGGHDSEPPIDREKLLLELVGRRDSKIQNIRYYPGADQYHPTKVMGISSDR